MTKSRPSIQARLTNWKDVGGPDQPIVPFNRESSSGTYSFFKDVALNKESFGKLQTVGANGELVEKVQSNPNALGYVGIAFVKPEYVKALRIYSPDLKHAVAATIENSINKTYPLVASALFLRS